MNALLSIQLLISVGASFLGIFAAIAGIFLSLGGWGAAIALWFLLNANTGWKALKKGVGVFGVSHNGEGAIALAVFTNFIIGAGLSMGAPRYSSWWGLLTPFVFLLTTLVLQIIYELCLNLINSKSKRN